MRSARATPLTSPVLVGRDDLLELADRRLDEARSGRGQVLLLAGEAGIGKTRLLGAIERRAALRGMAVVSAAAFPRDLETAGGPLLDLARALDSESGPRSDVGRRLLARLAEADARRRGDAHRHRRLLVADVADLVLGLADDRPLLVSFEDLHWADDLALEVLGQVARRVRSTRMLIVGTYRSDELYPRVPMRDWRSRLLTQRLAEDVRLARLDVPQTALLARALVGDPTAVPQQLVVQLHRRSDGIPLHVEELLGATFSDPDGATPEVPDTLSDAILARADRLPARARKLAEAAAIVGRSFDTNLVATLLERPADEIDRGLRDLQDRFFVLPGRRTGWYDFRHALIRDALYAATGPRARRRLHARVAELLSGSGSDDAAISAHFELAGLPAAAHPSALRAAQRASRLSGHREAVDLYRRALRTAPRDMPASERALILAECAAEAAAGDDNAAAADGYEEARQLLLEARDPGAAASLLPPLVAARHLLGAPLDERVDLLRRGLEELDAAQAPASDPTRAWLLAGMSAAYMLDRRLERSIEHGEAARAAAAEAADPAAELNASVTLGAVFVFAGRMDEGWTLLQTAVATARDAGLETEAARAYRMVGSAASVLVEYERAERWLREGIEYAERAELWNHRHYMGAHLAHVAWATGDPETAERLATAALTDGRGGITTRITALHVLGYLGMGRGDVTSAERWLREARAEGERMGELQRFSPAVWGLAEAALLDGRAGDALDLCEVGRESSSAVQDAAYLFPYLLTGTRALLELGRPLDAERWVSQVGDLLNHRSIPGTLPALLHADGLMLLARGSTRAARQRLAEARDAWSDRRRRWEETWALIDLARAEARSHRGVQAGQAARKARDLAVAIGADALAARSGPILRGLRVSRDANETWAPLTAREFQVATLIAGGKTNAEIAAELGIAPKTASSHVEHILDRLGATRRAEIAAWVGSRAPDRG